jgi:hypothetical protein
MHSSSELLNNWTKGCNAVVDNPPAYPRNHHDMALQPNTGPGLPVWGFVTITFLQGWIVSPAPNPQPGGPGLRIYEAQTGWPSYTPRHSVPTLVAFYDRHRLQWEYSLIPATTLEYPRNTSRYLSVSRLSTQFVQWISGTVYYSRPHFTLFQICKPHPGYIYSFDSYV